MGTHALACIARHWLRAVKDDQCDIGRRHHEDDGCGGGERGRDVWDGTLARITPKAITLKGGPTMVPVPCL